MRRTTGLLVKVVAALILATGGGALWYQVAGNHTIDRLLTENRDLKQAITNLSEETQIGYAKVLSQETRNGRLYTRLLFVETQPNEPLKPVLKKEFEIEGDVVHFDALIVTFGRQMVMDGKERAIYLWRRVYGETLPPNSGKPIQEPGSEPKRYQQIGERLSMQDRTLFWSEVWDLANDPNRLKDLGVQAVYGNVVYHKLQLGLIYVFKISSTGTLYPEVVPDL
ncbi:hypothetical protein ACFL6U_18030 [Planctomycetota bacterium]